MKYEERFQRYLDGDADEHESVQIEEDLEKMRILSSYLDSSWMPNCSRRKKEETRQAKMMDWAGRYPGR